MLLRVDRTKVRVTLPVPLTLALTLALTLTLIPTPILTLTITLTLALALALTLAITTRREWRSSSLFFHDLSFIGGLDTDSRVRACSSWLRLG